MLVNDKRQVPVRPGRLVIEHGPYSPQFHDAQSGLSRRDQRTEPLQMLAVKSYRRLGVSVTFAALARLKGLYARRPQLEYRVSDASIQRRIRFGINIYHGSFQRTLKIRLPHPLPAFGRLAVEQMWCYRRCLHLSTRQDIPDESGALLLELWRRDPRRCRWRRRQAAGVVPYCTVTAGSSIASLSAASINRSRPAASFGLS